MKISVLCHAERGLYRPHAFHLGGHRVPVVAILEEWEAPEHRYYRVRDFHGRRFVLRYCHKSSCWELEAVYGPAVRAAPAKPARTAA